MLTICKSNWDRSALCHQTELGNDRELNGVQAYIMHAACVASVSPWEMRRKEVWWRVGAEGRELEQRGERIRTCWYGMENVAAALQI